MQKTTIDIYIQTYLTFYTHTQISQLETEFHPHIMDVFTSFILLLLLLVLIMLILVLIDSFVILCAVSFY